MEILNNYIEKDLKNNESIMVVPEDKRRENLYKRYIDKLGDINLFIKNSKITNDYEEEYQNIGVITNMTNFDWDKNYDTIKEVFKFMDDYDSLDDFELELL